MTEKFKKIIDENFKESIALKNEILNSNITNQIGQIGLVIIDLLKNGGKVFFAGNGGSFADAQHLTAEFISRFLFDRNPLPAIALGTNSSNLSAISNDYAYSKVFSRELYALSSKKDMFIPITTSGKSKNLIEAVKIANKKGLKTVALTGATGGDLNELCECIKVPSMSVPRIQECHILIGHLLCEIAEEGIFKSKGILNE